MGRSASAALQLTARAIPAGARPAGSSVRRADLGWLALWMTGTLLSFTAVAVSVRALASTLSAFEMMTIRSAFGLTVLLVLLAARPTLRQDLSARRLKLHAVRNVLHFASQIGWTLAVGTPALICEVNSPAA